MNEILIYLNTFFIFVLSFFIGYFYNKAKTISTKEEIIREILNMKLNIVPVPMMPSPQMQQNLDMNPYHQSPTPNPNTTGKKSYVG